MVLQLMVAMDPAFETPSLSTGNCWRNNVGPGLVNPCLFIGGLGPLQQWPDSPLKKGHPCIRKQGQGGLLIRGQHDTVLLVLSKRHV